MDDSNKRLASTDAQAGTPPGPTLYIINLCASLAPVPTTGNTLPGLENYRLYQVARVEEGRTRHRLRLGFFTSESHANSVLAVVRQKYPTAFTASLSTEDQRFTRGHLPAQPPASQAAPSPAPSTSQTPQAGARNGAATPVTAAQTRPAQQPVGKTGQPPKPASPEIIEVTWEPDDAARAEASSARLKALTEDECLDEFTWEGPALQPAAAAPKPPPATARAPARPTAPTPTAKPVAAAASSPTGRNAPAAAPARIPAKAPATAPAAPSAASDIPVLTLSDTANAPQPTLALTPGDAPSFQPRSTAGQPTIARAPGTAQMPARPQNGSARNATPRPAAPNLDAELRAPPSIDDALAGPPGLDSTQTLRALTTEELKEDVQEKWFAIQLAASEQPANLDTMPHLDIFEAYRLYSVANAANGKITHSLRLGFFKEDVSAEAVCGYLKTFFPSPSVLRVSVAEQMRFREAPQPLRPSIEEARNNVIELNDARTARPAAVTPLTLAEPAAPMPLTGQQPAATKTPPAPVARPAMTNGAKPAAPQPRAAPRNAAPPIKRTPATRTKPSSKYRTKQSLTDALMDEARGLELGEGAGRKQPQNNSLLSRLVGKLTK